MSELRERIMEYKEKQLKKFELGLLMTGIAGILVLLFCAYLLAFVEQLASTDGTLRDNLYGVDVIIFSAAIGCGYSFINFNNLRHDDADLNRNNFLEFRAKTERYVSTSQGIMICNLFTLVYWAVYTSYLHIDKMLDSDGELVPFVMQNRIGLAIMLIAFLFSVLSVVYSFRMKNRTGFSKEEIEEMKKKKVVRRF